MHRTLILLTGVLILLFPSLSNGQIVEVSDPQVEMRGNVIHVSYIIYNSSPADEYTVELRVTDSNGRLVSATALKGDVGESVRGGGQKHIAWDLDEEQIVMNADISFQLYVKAVPPPEPVVVPPPVVKEDSMEEEVVEESSQDQLLAEETNNEADQPAAEVKETDDPVLKEEGTGTEEKEPEEEVVREDLQNKAEEKKPESEGETPVELKKPSGSKEFSRGGLMLQSAVFPGLGLTRYKGGPHWLKGVAAYGSMATSVALNRMAVSNFNKIDNQTDFESKDDLYHKLVKQDNTSEILAYAAIAIWVSDLVWTIIGTSDISRTASQEKGFRINSNIDPVSRAPLIAFTYKF